MENNTAEVALAMRNNPILVNKNAITTVANTSKKPSTHRCPSRVQPTRAVESPEAEPSKARTTRSRGCAALSLAQSAQAPHGSHASTPKLAEHRFS